MYTSVRRTPFAQDTPPSPRTQPLPLFNRFSFRKPSRPIAGSPRHKAFLCFIVFRARAPAHTPIQQRWRCMCARARLLARACAIFLLPFPFQGCSCVLLKRVMRGSTTATTTIIFNRKRPSFALSENPRIQVILTRPRTHTHTADRPSFTVCP